MTGGDAKIGLTDSNGNNDSKIEMLDNSKFEVVMVMTINVSVQPQNYGNVSKDTVFLWERWVISQ